MDRRINNSNMPQVTGLICDDINIMMIHNHRIKISDCSASLNCSKFGSLFTCLLNSKTSIDILWEINSGFISRVYYIYY